MVNTPRKQSDTGMIRLDTIKRTNLVHNYSPQKDHGKFVDIEMENGSKTARNINEKRGL